MVRAAKILNPLCKSDHPRTPPRSPSKEVCNRRIDFTKIKTNIKLLGKTPRKILKKLVNFV